MNWMIIHFGVFILSGKQMIATVGDKSDVCKSGVTSEHTTRDKNISHSYQENQAYYIHTY